MHMFYTPLLVTLLAATSSLLTTSSLATSIHANAMDVKPAHGEDATIPGTITNRGGPVMSSTTTVNYIWYGAFPATEKSLLYNFTKGLNGSKWWSINRQYGVGDIVLGSSHTTTVKKTTLTTAAIQSIVMNAISQDYGTPSPNAIYVVLTNSSIDQRDGGYGFCTDYCGWHDHMTVNGVDVKYAWIGSPVRCPSSCSTLSSNGANSPNNMFEMDSMVGIIAHELAETTSDEDLNAWYDAGGNENADKCAWTFGTTSTGTPQNPSGTWNEHIGNNYFLVQMNWGITPTQKCYN